MAVSKNEPKLSQKQINDALKAAIADSIQPKPKSFIRDFKNFQNNIADIASNPVSAATNAVKGGMARAAQAKRNAKGEFIKDENTTTVPWKELLTAINKLGVISLAIKNNIEDIKDTNKEISEEIVKLNERTGDSIDKLEEIINKLDEQTDAIKKSNTQSGIGKHVNYDAYNDMANASKPKESSGIFDMIKGILPEIVSGFTALAAAAIPAMVTVSAGFATGFIGEKIYEKYVKGTKLETDLADMETWLAKEFPAFGKWLYNDKDYKGIDNSKDKDSEIDFSDATHDKAMALKAMSPEDRKKAITDNKAREKANLDNKDLPYIDAKGEIHTPLASPEYHNKNKHLDRGDAFKIDPADEMGSIASVLAKEEGYKDTVYKDSGGKDTVGIGHKLTSKELKEGMIEIGPDEKVPTENKLTSGQVKRLFEKDLPVYINIAIKQLGKDNWNKLNVHQKAALVSYVYNVGHIPANFKKDVESGDFEGASSDIAHGVNTVDGKELFALTKRRLEESSVFNEVEPAVMADASPHTTGDRINDRSTSVSSSPTTIIAPSGGGGGSSVSGPSSRAVATGSGPSVGLSGRPPINSVDIINHA